MVLASRKANLTIYQTPKTHPGETGTSDLGLTNYQTPEIQTEVRELSLSLCRSLPNTFRSSLRSEISRSVRLAMSWTSCWILGGYSLGALSRGAPARASLLRWLLLLNCRAAQTPGTCCLAPPGKQALDPQKGDGETRGHTRRLAQPASAGASPASRGQAASKLRRTCQGRAAVHGPGSRGREVPAPKVARAGPSSPRPTSRAAQGGHAPAARPPGPAPARRPGDGAPNTPPVPGEAESCAPQPKPRRPQAARRRRRCRQHSSAGGKVTRGSTRKRRSSREQASWTGRSSREASRNRHRGRLLWPGSAPGYYALGGATRGRSVGPEVVRASSSPEGSGRRLFVSPAEYTGALRARSSPRPHSSKTLAIYGVQSPKPNPRAQNIVLEAWNPSANARSPFLLSFFF